MLKDLMRSAGRRAGIDIFRAAKDPFRWSHTVHDYHPVAPASRWRPGSLPQARLRGVLDRERSGYERFLDALEARAGFLHGIPSEADPADPVKPYWANTWFTALDAAALVTLLAWHRPARYLEIGSGTSTCFARYAVDNLGLPTRITSIDPQPRRHIDAICDRVVRAPLEAVDLAVFDDLEPGDVVFFDGSHRAFPNSDVTVFFFEILPRLKPGVHVHIHDIFIPDDYPAGWAFRLYNEQYLLAAMLLCEGTPFRVSLPVMYVCQDPALGPRVRRIFAPRDGGAGIPFLYPNDVETPGASFWMETIRR